MKTCTIRRRIEVEHIDSGNHANWLAQLKIAQECHFTLRDQLGLGLDCLKKEHDLFLVMRKVEEVEYLHQIRLGQEVDVEITMFIAGKVRLGFFCEFKLAGKVVTKMQWFMPLIILSTDRPARIPDWIRAIIGDKIPLHLQTTPKSAKAQP